MFLISKQSLLLLLSLVFISGFSYASDLNLDYYLAKNTQAYQYKVQQKTSYINSDAQTSNAFKNMGADGRRNMLESDARNRKQAEKKSKGKGKGKGKGQGNGQGKGKGRGQHSQDM